MLIVLSTVAALTWTCACVIIVPALSCTGALASGPCGHAQGHGFDRQFDIVTGLPVRDVLMEPLNTFASWQRSIFGGSGQSQQSYADDQSDETTGS